jgi:hypothetical protein
MPGRLELGAGGRWAQDQAAGPKLFVTYDGSQPGTGAPRMVRGVANMVGKIEGKLD